MCNQIYTVLKLVYVIVYRNKSGTKQTAKRWCLIEFIKQSTSIKVVII